MKSPSRRRKPRPRRRADVLVLGRYADEARPGPELAARRRAAGRAPLAGARTEQFEGKAGQIAHFHHRRHSCPPRA